jgi:hypothetical protein
MFERIFQYCLFNAVDFLMAGYSFQLTLLDLRRIRCIKEPVAALVDALIKGLENAATKELFKDVILLAHLKSQSFYQEMYTDLYDFCFCINNKIAELGTQPCHCTNHPTTSCTLPTLLKNLDNASKKVRTILMKENPGNPDGIRHRRIIISAEFLGPSYQYSRGLSVYFPWTRPVGDRLIMAEYERYRFHQELKQKSWLDFLNKYFTETRRKPSIDEQDDMRFLPALRETESDSPNGENVETRCGHTPKCPPLLTPAPIDPCAPPVYPPPPSPGPPSPCEMERDERELKEDIANLVYGEGPSLGSYELDGKTGPRDPTGISDCDCPTIKNYPQDTRPRRQRAESAVNQPHVEVTQADFL